LGKRAAGSRRATRSVARSLNEWIMFEKFAADVDVAEARVADRLAIADAAYLYTEAVDVLGNSPAIDGEKDEAPIKATGILGKCLTENAQLRLFLGGPDGPSSLLGPGGPAGVAAAVRAYFKAYRYVGTQHSVANVRIAFTGLESADATSQVACFHRLADQRMLLAPVSYRDSMARAGGRWKIAKRDIFAIRFWVAAGYAPNPHDPSLSRPG
jgi:hypothetical protein